MSRGVGTFLRDSRDAVIALRLLVLAGLAMLGLGRPPTFATAFWVTSIAYGLTNLGYMVSGVAAFLSARVQTLVFVLDVLVVSALIVMRGANVPELILAYFTLVLMAAVVQGVGTALLNALVVCTVFAAVSIPLGKEGPVASATAAHDVSGGRLATEHLLQRGAQQPALLTSRSRPQNLREQGYREVLTEAGIVPEIMAVDFHTPENERFPRITTWLDAVQGRVDAVFATDDLMAATVLEWAHRAGRRVPEDFKVVGFDGTLAVRRALPGLTTIQQPIDAICRQAVDLLLRQIEGRVTGQALDQNPLALVELPVTLVPGWTT